MKTKQDFTNYYKKHGLYKTIDDFCFYVRKETRDIVFAGYTFDHIALGDFNLSDSDIDFCLEPERIREWFYQRYLDLEGDGVNYLSDNEWERFKWDNLVKGTELIISFLEWLKTIPEDVRDHLDGYWEICS